MVNFKIAKYTKSYCPWLSVNFTWHFTYVHVPDIWGILLWSINNQILTSNLTFTFLGSMYLCQKLSSRQTCTKVNISGPNLIIYKARKQFFIKNVSNPANSLSIVISTSWCTLRSYRFNILKFITIKSTHFVIPFYSDGIRRSQNFICILAKIQSFKNYWNSGHWSIRLKQPFYVS